MEDPWFRGTRPSGRQLQKPDEIVAFPFIERNSWALARACVRCHVGIHSNTEISKYAKQ
jgi:hypothetical protein